MNLNEEYTSGHVKKKLVNQQSRGLSQWQKMGANWDNITKGIYLQQTAKITVVSGCVQET